MAIICPICGAENPDSAEYCNLCLGSMGFFGSDIPIKDDHSFYPNKYPSSFSTDVPVPDDEAGAAPVEASPADVGEYGVASGYDYELSVVTEPEKDTAGPKPESVIRKKVRKAV
jgi:hypothetical protein